MGAGFIGTKCVPLVNAGLVKQYHDDEISIYRATALRSKLCLYIQISHLF